MNKLMIIEDSKDIRDELKTLLTRYGFKVFAPDEFENIIDFICIN